MVYRAPPTAVAAQIGRAAGELVRAERLRCGLTAHSRVVAEGADPSWVEPPAVKEGSRGLLSFRKGFGTSRRQYKSSK